MAGDWIKMRCDLHEDPAVISMAAALDLDEDTVVGKLHRLWSWADRHTTDGNAVGVTETWVDRHVNRSGFAQAMSGAGWLTISAAGITFPNFDRHNLQSAKRRALGSLRVEKYRGRRNAEGNAENNGASVTTTLP
jgi:hypothetical protein